MTTRADLCMAACEGLTDAEVRTLISNGGLHFVLECGRKTRALLDLSEAMLLLPKRIAEAQGNMAKARSMLISMLAEIEKL
jgi:hypothetical protein